MARKETSGQKRIAFVVSEKGGVGKSVFTRSLVDYLRADTGVRVAAYDADGSVGGLARVAALRDDAGRIILDQNPAEGVGFYDVRSDNERGGLVNCLGSDEALIVHDLAGGSLNDVMKVVDNGAGLKKLLATFDEYGYRLVLFHIVSADVGSSISVGRWLDLLGDDAGRVDNVAVVNRQYSDHPYWTGFKAANGAQKGGKTRERLLASGGVEVSLPKLHDGTFAIVDAENLLPSTARGSGVLTIQQNSHVAGFRSDFAEGIAPAKKFLGIA